MEYLLKPLLEYGSMGIVLAVMLFFNYRLTTKLFTVIENNTKALADFKGVLESVRDKL